IDQPFAAGDGARALLPAETEVSSHALELLFGHQRSDLRLRIEPVADAKSVAELSNPIDELLIDAFLDEQPGASTADLAGVGKHRHSGARDGGLDFGVGKYDVRRLAAEFEGDALEIACRRPND